jgi:hypothetical protein
MKLLSKRTSEILKSVLLYSLLIAGASAQVLVSSDRYILKILDRTISVQDIHFQLRNLKALECVYDDALTVQYFEKGFIQDLEKFLKTMPSADDDVRRHLHSHETMMRKIRHLFKMLRYSEDQKSPLSPQLKTLIRDMSHQNKCEAEVLYKDTLKTNFINLINSELYLRTRYSNQIKAGKSFEPTRSSIDLFVDSLDKQFTHEYYW